MTEIENVDDHREAGAALVEYGLLVAMIALVCVGALTLFGALVAALFNVAI